MSKNSVRKDLYKILQVSRTATMLEIKTAYRKLALALHPDRHGGCTDKTKAFKEASEAYNILIDNERRKEYDLATGWAPADWYNKNRRRPPPANYRKVYAPHAPPDGRWHDAQKHYDFHYGDGMFREAVKTAYTRAKANGEFDYHSPLGKGFAFETKEDRRKKNSSSSSSSSSSRYGQNSYYKNPYSKEPQGPPTIQFNYEEGTTGNLSAKNDRREAKSVLKRKQTVVDKLHERRQERYNKQQQQQESHYSSAREEPIFQGQRVYTQYNQQPITNNDSACIVM